MHQMYLTDVYRKFYPNIKEYAFYLATHRSFSKNRLYLETHKEMKGLYNENIKPPEKEIEKD